MKRQINMDEISDGKLYSGNDMVKADCNGCKDCSKCCSGMGNSIILDPYDIARIAYNTGLNFNQISEKYIELNVVDGVILPNIKMNEKDKCSFLDSEGRCKIHEFRPGFCRMFPLGRIYDENGFKYFLQMHECPYENKTKIKVKKWLGIPNLKDYEEYINKYHKMLKFAEGKIIEEPTIVKDINMDILNTLYVTPYKEESVLMEISERIDNIISRYR